MRSAPAAAAGANFGDGAVAHRSKLTNPPFDAHEVLEILRDTRTYREIAKDYDVTRNAIRSIKTGRTYRAITHNVPHLLDTKNNKKDRNL